jgi:hypothetical protein
MRDLYSPPKPDGRILLTPRIRVPEMKGTATAPDRRALPATVLGGRGRVMLLAFPDVAASHPPALAAGEGKVNLYFRIHFDWFAVE